MQEDPTFKVETDRDTGQTKISGMGELHLEIIVDRLKREFNVEANVGKTQVAFTADELSYSWGGITPVPGLSALKAQASLARDVSCPAPGNCAVVGNYLTPSGQRVPFVTNRVWTDPTTTVVKAKAASAKYGNPIVTISTASVVTIGQSSNAVSRGNSSFSRSVPRDPRNFFVFLQTRHPGRARRT